MIEIKQAKDGSWCVVFHSASGLVHDFFNAQQKAEKFALEFYGVSA